MRSGLELAGRYRLEEPLGVGGMGQVWRARDLRLGRLVAVKVLPEQVGADSTGVARLRREAEIAAGLQHPNITVVFDIGEHDRMLFVVMELLNGNDLGKLLTRRPGLSVRQAVSFAEQVSEALTAAHQSGIVHRDIKPANLVVLAGGRVKICDFGIARLVADTSHLTGTGRIGTPLYMAPEQFTGGRIDGRTDLYALGGVLHQMLTGRPPFPADQGVPALMHAHLNRPPPSPRSRRPDIPAELDRLVRHLLAKQPVDRPADAGSVTERLHAISLDGPSRREEHPPPSAVRSSTKTHTQQTDRGLDIETELTLTFAQAFDGATVAPPGEGTCFACAGTGADPSPARRPCPHCARADLETQAFCSRCDGTATVPDTNAPCPLCRGEGRVLRPTTTLRVPPGVSDGQRLRLRGRGILDKDGGPNGDLYYVIRVEPHPVFGIRGGNLAVTVPVSADEAAHGATIKAPTCRGSPITLRIPAKTRNGTQIRVRRRGVPQRDGPTSDLIVTISVQSADAPHSSGAEGAGRTAMDMREDLLREARQI